MLGRDALWDSQDSVREAATRIAPDTPLHLRRIRELAHDAREPNRYLPRRS